MYTLVHAALVARLPCDGSAMQPQEAADVEYWDLNDAMRRFYAGLQHHKWFLQLGHALEDQ